MIPLTHPAVDISEDVMLLDGSQPMEDDLNMDSNFITNLPEPTLNHHAVNLHHFNLFGLFSATQIVYPDTNINAVGNHTVALNLVANAKYLCMFSFYVEVVNTTVVDAARWEFGGSSNGVHAVDTRTEQTYQEISTATTLYRACQTVDVITANSGGTFDWYFHTTNGASSTMHRRALKSILIRIK